MIRKLILSLAGIFCLAGVFAQSTNVLTGKVLDQEGRSIPYANVGVPGCSGTVTNDAGEFTISVADCKPTDTLRISMIGFHPVIYILQNVNRSSPLQIVLKESQYDLKEVKVRSRKMTNKEKGNFNQSERYNAGFKTNDLGSEIVIRIPVKNDAWIKKFNFFIARSIYDTLFFRLNVYKMEHGKPGVNVLPHPIYVTTTSKNGWVSVNIEKYNIVVEDDFAIGLEWVRDLKGGPVSTGLTFSVGFLNKNCYYRKASQQEWNSTGYFGVGFNVIVAE